MIDKGNARIKKTGQGSTKCPTKVMMNVGA